MPPEDFQPVLPPFDQLHSGVADLCMTALSLAQGLRMVLHLTRNEDVGTLIICKDRLQDSVKALRALKRKAAYKWISPQLDSEIAAIVSELKRRKLPSRIG